MVRCCLNCKHLKCWNGLPVCYEGGFTEIGDETKEITEEECNAFELKEERVGEIFRIL